MKQYTKSSKYIDSDYEAIKETAEQVVGAEIMPYKVAEKLYNYVVQKLEYDYEKLAQINSEKFGGTNKASDILNIDMDKSRGLLIVSFRDDSDRKN